MLKKNKPVTKELKAEAGLTWPQKGDQAKGGIRVRNKESDVRRTSSVPI